MELSNIQRYMVEVLEDVVNTPSPSGYTKDLIFKLKNMAEEMGFATTLTNRKALIIHVCEGERTTLLAAHADTLGGMVRTIMEDGTLKLLQIGGYMIESVEGEYCVIHTRGGEKYTGTVLTSQPSVHVYLEARELKRTDDCVRIRLDADVHSKKEVEALGIERGDYISFEPRFQVLENGYIKSRHLDDKASVAVLMALLKDISEGKVKPAIGLKLMITNYEEVGFGASYIPEGIQEMIAVDMGAVGDDLDGDEKKVSIVTKDAYGPYDYDLTSRLIQVAKEKKLDYEVECYRRYKSDTAAAITGGRDICHGLIGQGVQASHHMERTHIDGMTQTLALLEGYIQG